MRCLALMMCVVLTGACSSSREPVDAGSGTDAGAVTCGTDTCASGETCCTGCDGAALFCSRGCPPIACPPPPPPCDSCAAGEVCCPGCPGEAGFCGRDPCPRISCPPPPPECDGCGAGQTCCPSCPGDPSFCVDGSACPVFDCPAPPPGCEACEERGERCCLACPGEPGICVPSDSPCPDVVCPPRACAGLGYCACNVECVPLIDLSTGCFCEYDDPFNCTGEPGACICGGATYLGCVTRGVCSQTMIDCGRCPLVYDDAGCPSCDSACAET